MARKKKISKRKKERSKAAKKAKAKDKSKKKVKQKPVKIKKRKGGTPKPTHKKPTHLYHLKKEPVHKQEIYGQRKIEKDNEFQRFLAAVSYVLGPISGLAVLLTQKNRFVRFHALQSFLYWIFIGILALFLLIFLGGPVFFTSLSKLLSGEALTSVIFNPDLLIVGTGLLVLFPLAILLINLVALIEAHRGEKFKLPIVGRIADKLC